MNEKTEATKAWTTPELNKGSVAAATEAGGPGITDAGVLS